MSDRVIRKVKKLMAIADGDNTSEAEIQNALAHAQKMMDDHHLSEEDIRGGDEPTKEDVDKAEFSQQKSWIGGKMYAWEGQLASFVSELTGQQCYVNYAMTFTNAFGAPQLVNGKRVQRRAIMWYGIVDEAIAAKELYDEIRTLISTMAYGKYGGIYMGDGGLYCQGFVRGLYTQLNETKKLEHDRAKESVVNAGMSAELMKELLAKGTDFGCYKPEGGTDCTALAVIDKRKELIDYKHQVASKWLEEETNIKLGSKQRHTGASSRSADGGRSAFSSGKSDGKKADTSRKPRRKRLT